VRWTLIRRGVRVPLPAYDRISLALMTRRITRFRLRACARVALCSLALIGGLGLAGCASIDELKSTMSGWFATGKFPGADEEMFAGDVPDASHSTAPEKTLREGQSKASKKEDKPVRRRQPPQTVKLQKKPPVSATAEAVKPQRAEPQSASSPAEPSRLRNLWPEPPAPGSFSR
jgi:hypothetical protein